MVRDRRLPALLAISLALPMLSSCASKPPINAAPAAPAQRALARAAVVSEDAFLAAITQHCGQAFEGRVLVDTPVSPNNNFAGKALIMHVRECHADSIRIPFHVGEDRSRTWVLTRTASGLRLKHDHRHQDGSHDKVTMYGGNSAAGGTAVRQSFPVDAESIAGFNANGLAASVTNTWAMEIEPGRRFLYELSRPNGRLFQVEFDLSRPVAVPPAPWGSGDEAR